MMTGTKFAVWHWCWRSFSKTNLVDSVWSGWNETRRSVARRCIFIKNQFDPHFHVFWQRFKALINAADRLHEFANFNPQFLFFLFWSKLSIPALVHSFGHVKLEHVRFNDVIRIIGSNEKDMEFTQVSFLKWPGPKWDRPDLSYKKWNKTHHIDGISLRSIPPIISKKMTFKVQVLEIFIRFSLELSAFNVLGVLNNFLNVESTL